MDNDVKQCEECPWPLECCTEDEAPKVKPVAADCPKDHAVWERRMGEAHLLLPATAVVDEDDLVGV